MTNHLNAIEGLAASRPTSESERRLRAVRTKINRVRAARARIMSRYEMVTMALDVEPGNAHLEAESVALSRSLENFRAQIAALRDAEEALKVKIQKRRTRGTFA